MTIREAIARVSLYRSPAMPEADCLKVISDVDARALREIIEPQGGPATQAFTLYTPEDGDRELMIPYPYDSVYADACCAEIDRRENQIGNLSNARRDYESAFADYARYYRRTHKPDGRQLHSGWYGI